MSVAAGSSVSFTSDVAVYHDGPISVYMAKAPTTAAEFDGSGDVWFKILDIGPIFPGGTWNLMRKYSPHTSTLKHIITFNRLIFFSNPSSQRHTHSTSQPASPTGTTFFASNHWPYTTRGRRESRSSTLSARRSPSRAAGRRSWARPSPSPALSRIRTPDTR